MPTHQTLSTISDWGSELGMLSIPLFKNNNADTVCIMLNGAEGNFCLDVEQKSELQSEKQFRDFAWSSDVGHYLRVENEALKVFRWDSSQYESYTIRSISNNIERFHKYLSKNQPKKEYSIVSFINRLFRRLWNSLNTRDGSVALQALLYLIACAFENNKERSLDPTLWGLDEQIILAVNVISPNEWEYLVNELTNRSSSLGLKAELDLVLRHSAGRLFQEAHYQATNEQFVFEGIVAAPIAIQKNKSAIGAHYTPSFLARTLIEETFNEIDLNNDAITIFDPACGSGEFFRESIRYAEKIKYTGLINFIGWDISVNAITICKFIQSYELKKYSNVSFELKATDSLDKANKFPSQVDAIIMNPPFLSWDLMDISTREKVESINSAGQNGKPSLASAFLQKAVDSVKDSGVISSIVPSIIFDGNSYKNLRTHISQDTNCKFIGRLGGQLIFYNATTHVGMLVLKKGSSYADYATVFWSDYQKESTLLGLRALRKFNRDTNGYPINEKNYSIYKREGSLANKDNWTPVPFNLLRIKSVFADFNKAGDIFSIKQGARTGLQSEFIISKEALLELPKSERHYFRPAVVNESIRKGRLTDVAYVFYPYGAEYSVNSEQELQTKLPTFYQRILKPNKAILLKRAGIDSNFWWRLTRHREWQVKPSPKVVSTEFGGPGSFAWDETGEFVAARSHAWIPKKIDSFPPDLGLAYCALLNSKRMTDLIQSVSKQIGVAQWYLSAQYLNNLPLPNLFDEYFNENAPANTSRVPLIANLTNIGMQMGAGLPYSDEELEYVVDALYDFKLKF